MNKQPNKTNLRRLGNQSTPGLSAATGRPRLPERALVRRERPHRPSLLPPPWNQENRIKNGHQSNPTLKIHRVEATQQSRRRSRRKPPRTCGIGDGGGRGDVDGGRPRHALQVLDGAVEHVDRGLVQRGERRHLPALPNPSRRRGLGNGGGWGGGGGWGQGDGGGGGGGVREGQATAVQVRRCRRRRR